MDLWVLNQDEDELVILKQIELNEEEIIGLGPDNHLRALGIYKTAKRAKEVFKEIQKIICPFEDIGIHYIVDENPHSDYLNEIKNIQQGKLYFCKEPPKVELQQLNSVLYKMPKE